MLDHADDGEFLSPTQPGSEEKLDGGDRDDFEAFKKYVYDTCVAVDLPD